MLENGLNILPQNNKLEVKFWSLLSQVGSPNFYLSLLLECGVWEAVKFVLKQSKSCRARKEGRKGLICG